jgi:hypothetical protein
VIISRSINVRPVLLLSISPRNSLQVVRPSSNLPTKVESVNVGAVNDLINDD